MSTMTAPIGGRRMFSFRSIKTHVVLGSGLCLAGCCAAIISLAAYRVHERSHTSAAAEASAQASRRAADVGSALNRTLQSATTLAGILAKVKDDSNALDLTRDQVNNLLRGMLEENPAWLGTYTCWEPNAFDGMDKGFANTPGHDATGRFIPYWNRGGGTVAVEPLKFYDTPGDGDYYILPRTTRRQCIIEPYVYPVGGKDVLMTSIVIPILNKGEFYGIVGVDLSLAFLQEMADGADVLGGDGELSLISAKGLVAASAGRPALAGKPVKELSPDLETALAASARGGNIQTTVGDNLWFAQPITIGDTQTPWAAVVRVSAAQLNQAATQLVLQLIGVGVACVAAGVTALWFLASSLVRPVRQICDRIRDIADGEGDLTQRVDESRADELGELARWFNRFVANIRNVVTSVAAATEQVTAASTEIARAAQQTTESAARQEQQTVQVAAAVDQMAASVAHVATQSGQASTVADTSRKDATSGGSIVERTVAQITHIADDVRQSANAISELGARSQQIGDIIRVINEVAEQTNLLALNAAIEAARAGEHGRGFAVVADEVRKLAERTTSATKNVAESISQIQTQTLAAVERIESGARGVQAGVDLANEAGTALSRITSSSDGLASMVRTIAAASTQQSQASQTIAQSIAQISELTRETSSIANQTARISHDLGGQAATLETLVRKFKLS